MKTKIIYVLSSSFEDYFYEQCFISVMSARHYNPSAYIGLVCDDKTALTLIGKRGEIKGLLTDLKIVNFDSKLDNTIRSRKMKIGLRQLIDGDYLYVDCDTLITGDLSAIDENPSSLAAVLDGHTLMPNHPMRDFFAEQNKHLSYSFEDVTQYFSGGVIYSKDNFESHNFYDIWKRNYEESLGHGIKLDEPPLSLTNVQLNFPMKELEGIWNCQIRFGALYLSSAKILHFCSKKNMPVCILGKKGFLAEIKKYGIHTPMLAYYISDWRKTIPSSLVICTGIDAYYNVDPSYEKGRKAYYNKRVENTLYRPKNHNIFEFLRSIRNKVLGRFKPIFLSKILYKEKVGVALSKEDKKNLNVVISNIAFHTNIQLWSTLADKIKVREYVASAGLEDILLPIYSIWDKAENIDLTQLPPSFVIKCNHDNGSTIIVEDKYSIDIDFLKDFISKKMKKKFGLQSAEPHYRTIRPVVFAEKLLENDKNFSDSVVCYKFFSTYGCAEYCQVVYNSTNHHFQRSVIYKIDCWEKCIGFLLKGEGTTDIPRPVTLNRMIEIVQTLGKELPFARIDLYEWNNQVYFSEITLMPGAGRITNFSKSFLCELGSKVKVQQS